MPAVPGTRTKEHDRDRNVRVADQPLPTRFVMLADKPTLA
jgi:hypothetical protein